MEKIENSVFSFLLEVTVFITTIKLSTALYLDLWRKSVAVTPKGACIVSFHEVSATDTTTNLFLYCREKRKQVFCFLITK